MANVNDAMRADIRAMKFGKALLSAPSESARQIMQALNLPPQTVAFTLRMRAGEVATLEVETYAPQDGAEDLVNVLKRYRLEEIEDANDVAERETTA